MADTTEKKQNNAKLSKEEIKAQKLKEKQLDKARIAEEKRQDKEARFKIEDPLGFMRIINIISVVLVISALFFGIRYLINMSFLHKYNKGVYQAEIEEFLSKLNIPEGYLPYYNAGNAYYMLEDYDSAIACYEDALDSHPTEKKECDIRVNLALAMLHKIDFDHIDTEKQKESAIRTLQAARNVLVENGCADPYGTEGHDPEAEQLKQDIDKMLEQLGAEPQPPNSDDEQENQDKSNQEEEQKKKSRREQQLEKELNKQKQENMKERQETQDAANQRDDQKDSQGSSSGGGEGEDDSNGKTW